MRKTKNQCLLDEVARLEAELARTNAMLHNAHSSHTEALAKFRMSESAMEQLHKRLETADKRIDKLLHVLAGFAYPLLRTEAKLSDYEGFKRLP